jgi:hypothetical protein
MYFYFILWYFKKNRCWWKTNNPVVWQAGLFQFCHLLWTLWENFVDRLESYDSISAKSCIFLAHEKVRTVWGIFLYFHTQPDPQQGIKKFLRHFSNTLVPSQTLQISHIVQSSLQSITLEFFAYPLPYSRSPCLVTWEREIKFCKVSNGTRVVGKCLTNFWHFDFGQVAYRNREIYPKPCARNTQLLALNESSVNKIFPESYDFAAILPLSISFTIFSNIPLWPTCGIDSISLNWFNMQGPALHTITQWC